MSKLTLDMNTFKALASDTRLDILRALDGKKLSLNDICKATNLNKATLHEHLAKLNEAGLVKRKERDGHKWVYYKLTWKGEGLLHPENTRIVVMFSSTFISLLIAVILIVNFLQPIPIGIAETVDDITYLYEIEDRGIPLFQRSYNLNYLGEVDAREKTVGNITTELQSKAPRRNSIGFNYDDEDIVWGYPDSGHISSDDALSFDVTSAPSYDSVILDSYSQNYAPIDNQQLIVYRAENWTNIDIDKNISVNETEKGYGDIEADNETNESASGLMSPEGMLGFYPAVPVMIATVQDTTLLYLAVACLMFFGTVFTISLWRLKANKKPKL